MKFHIPWCLSSPVFVQVWQASSQLHDSVPQNRLPVWVLKPMPLPAPSLAAPVSSAARRIFSVVIGGLIIGTINNGEYFAGQTYYQLVVMGGLIIAAVAPDRLISK